MPDNLIGIDNSESTHGRSLFEQVLGKLIETLVIRQIRTGQHEGMHTGNAEQGNLDRGIQPGLDLTGIFVEAVFLLCQMRQINRTIRRNQGNQADDGKQNQRQPANKLEVARSYLFFVFFDSCHDLLRFGPGVLDDPGLR